MTSYQVELDVYTGPLDLLLHLVERAEVSIYDIPVAVIADRFLAHLRTMPELDLDTTADFLVVAATLLALKARLLLPVAAPAEGEETPEEEVDPREELVRRLLAYRQFKTAAANLGALLASENARFDPGTPRLLPAPPSAVEPGCLSNELAALALAYQAARAAAAAEPPEHRIRPVPFSVAEKMAEVLDRLRQSGSLPFTRLFAANRTRGEVVATFLAVLELIRLGRVWARQDRPLGRLDLIFAERSDLEGEERE
ncbi:MAG: segregation and condensation protein A [Chitinophagales bacterium]